MSSPSKPAPAPAPVAVDPQLAIALRGHGDALTILRDALRWRAIERHLVVYEVSGYTGVRIAPALRVPGRVAPVAGLLVDAYMSAMRLGVNLSERAVPAEDAPHD